MYRVGLTDIFMEIRRKWTRVQETSNRNIYGNSTKLNRRLSEDAIQFVKC